MTEMTIALLPAAAISDYQVFADLHEKAFSKQDERPWTADAFGQLVESPGMEVWLACAGDRPVGYILTRRILDEAELISIGVDPAFQQTGCGSQMLNTAVAHLAQNGVETLFLEVRADNDAARKFYDRQGFMRIGIRHDYYQTLSGKRVNALCLRFSIK